MSVSLTFTIGLTALQRVQPLDPSFQADWSASLTGDVTGGTSVISADFPADLGVIFEYASALESAGVITDGIFSTRLGQTAGPAAVVQLAIHHETTVVTAGLSVFYWEPPRTMIIPTVGGAVQIEFRAANSDGSALVFHGRAYCWPRNEVIGLPQRTFWPYLTH